MSTERIILSVEVELEYSTPAGREEAIRLACLDVLKCKTGGGGGNMGFYSHRPISSNWVKP